MCSRVEGSLKSSNEILSCYLKLQLLNWKYFVYTEHAGNGKHEAHSLVGNALDCPLSPGKF